MERLRRWFGGRGESDKVTADKGDNPVMVKSVVSEFPQNARVPSLLNVPASSAPASSAPVTPTASVSPSPIPTDAKVTETRVGQLMNELREMILKVVPLREGDCLSCKLIGSGVAWGAAAYVALTYSKSKKGFTGFRRKLFAVQAMSFVTGLTLLGTARMFDMSIFEPPDAEGNKRGLGELVLADLQNFQKLGSKLFADNSGSQDKKES